MKSRILSILCLATVIFASCKKESATVGERFPLDNAIIDVTADFASKAAKKDWAEGDKINIWFDADYANRYPDLVLKYNGSTWDKFSVREAATVSSSGVLCALYETTNDLDGMYQSATTTGTTFKGKAGSVWATQNFNATPMLAAANGCSYTYDSGTTKLTSTIGGWNYLTRFKVLVKNLTLAADRYALKVYRPDSTEILTKPINAFGTKKDESTGNAVVYATIPEQATFYTVGVQESDGIAFYFDALSATAGERVNFGLRISGVDDKIYTVNAKVDLTESQTACIGVNLNFNNFIAVIDGGIAAELLNNGGEKELDTPSEFKVVYEYDDRDDSLNFEYAKSVSDALGQATSKYFEVVKGSKKTAGDHEIIVGHTNSGRDVSYYSGKKDGGNAFEYQVEEKNNNVYVYGIGSWALKEACDKFVADFQKNGYVEGKKISGTVRGKILFPYTTGCNLRILDWNIWERGNPETNPDLWNELGESCKDTDRVKNITQVVRAYNFPDVFTMQEVTNTFYNKLKDSLSTLGYEFSKRTTDDYTPIIYNTNKVTFVKQYHEAFPTYTEGEKTIDPKGKKSYTAFVLQHKSSGKQFIVVTGHLWADVGNDMAYRCKLSEATIIYNGINTILATYNVPVFFVGDMNCKRTSNPMKLFRDNGYDHLCDIVPGSDGSMGWHPCDDGPLYTNNGVFREYDPAWKAYYYGWKGYDWWMGYTYDRNEKGANCVDQFYLYNYKGSVEAKAFERIHAYFTIYLADHYPNYADFIL